MSSRSFMSWVALATRSEGVSLPAGVCSHSWWGSSLALVHEGVRPVGAAIGGAGLRPWAAAAVPGIGRVGDMFGLGRQAWGEVGSESDVTQVVGVPHATRAPQVM